MTKELYPRKVWTRIEDEPGTAASGIVVEDHYKPRLEASAAAGVTRTLEMLDHADVDLFWTVSRLQPPTIEGEMTHAVLRAADATGELTPEQLTWFALGAAAQTLAMSEFDRVVPPQVGNRHA